MGREIRRVPPNWEHPKDSNGKYIPLYDHDYETAAKQWLKELLEWEAGDHEARERNKEFCRYYWEYQGPPREEECRPKFAAEPTWFQVYETVTEGTPVSPPFETPEALAHYLSTEGDYWHQRRTAEGRYSDGTPTYEAALHFVKSGFAMSGLFSTKTGFLGPYQQHEPENR